LLSRKFASLLPYRFVLIQTATLCSSCNIAGKRSLDHSQGQFDPRPAPHKVAAREALEEAGLLGRIERACIGTFEFERRRDGADIVVASTFTLST
jgi:hypothetical protein